ncbi:hypothetical protein BKP42_68050 [Rhodococcus erythropolis]|nr:hypothetical protein BKP42_68050 [Rhodococcus erythropolis]
MSPAAHRRTRRFESHIPRRSARPGHLGRSRHQIRNDDSPGNPVDNQVVRSNDQAPRAGGTEVDPHELNHHAVSRIQSAESLVEALGSREDNCRLVRSRVDIDAAEQILDVHGSGLGDRHPPSATVGDQPRAEHVVVVDDCGECSHDVGSLHSEWKRESHRLRESVVAATALDHESFDRRQRHPADATARQLLEHHGGLDVGGVLRHFGQCCDSLALEDVTGCEYDSTCLRTRDELDRHDRVAALGEERVVGADSIEAENVREDLAQDLFHLGNRGPEFLGLEDRRRESSSVQLAGRAEWHLRGDHDRSRNHMSRKGSGDEFDQFRRSHRSVLSGEYVRHQCRSTRRQGRTHRRRELDLGVCGQRRVDLTEFDPETANLDLEIVAAHVFHCVSRGCGSSDPAHNVTGSVHSLARITVRVCHESIGTQARATMITAGHLWTGQVQLARDSEWNWIESCVQNEGGHVTDRGADVHSVTRQKRNADVRHDRRLGRAVDIQERPGSRSRCGRVVPRRPLADQFRRIRFAAHTYDRKVVQAARVHRRQSRWCDERMRDSFATEHLSQFVAAVHARRDDDHRRAGGHREEQLEHRRVETR